jgi:hypothetical protein
MKAIPVTYLMKVIPVTYLMKVIPEMLPNEGYSSNEPSSGTFLE